MSLKRLLPPCSALALGALLLGCGGATRPGDHVATINWTLKVEPSAPQLAPGQTVQFSASTPWGHEAVWAVMPAAAGTFSPAGLFTATTPGACKVYAVWSKDVRYTASTDLTILPAPPPQVISPNLVQASGNHQAVPGTNVSHGLVLGEIVPASTVVAADDPTLRVRHGFQPPK